MKAALFIVLIIGIIQSVRVIKLKNKLCKCDKAFKELANDLQA